MKHLKTYKEIQEKNSYDAVISEYPFLEDDSYYPEGSFKEYVFANTNETSLGKLGYDNLLNLAHEWIAVNYNILQNNANPSGE